MAIFRAHHQRKPEMRGNSLPALAPPTIETDDDPLPFGDCIFVMLVANALCYGLGYAVFVGVRSLVGL
jgi:hypothetical protein